MGFFYRVLGVSVVGWVGQCVFLILCLVWVILGLCCLGFFWFKFKIKNVEDLLGLGCFVVRQAGGVIIQRVVRLVRRERLGSVGIWLFVGLVLFYLFVGQAQILFYCLWVDQNFIYCGIYFSFCDFFLMFLGFRLGFFGYYSFCLVVRGGSEIFKLFFGY